MSTLAIEQQADLVVVRENSIHQSIRREHAFEELRVEGEIPSDLNGTLYRNGPGLYELFGKAYHHMFEGDGAVSAVRFKEGKAWGALKVVQSLGLLEEKRQGKPLYGFNAPWWRRVAGMFQGKMKNTANTNVIAWQDRLFALMEGGLPTELSMEDLSTIGETNFDVIPQSFSAHPHLVPGRNALYNFGLSYGPKTTLDLFEFPRLGQPRCLSRIDIGPPIMLHDFMATENHMVFFLSPVKLKILRAMLALGPFDKLFRWDPSAGTEIIVVPIDAPDQVTRFKTDPFFQFHFANGFERGDELIIDYVRYPDFSVMDALRAEDGDEKARVQEDWGKLTRAIVNPKTKTIKHDLLWDKICDFPRVHPRFQARDYRYLWLSTEPEERADGSKEPHEIVRKDLQTQEVQRHIFAEWENPSEPVFVARDGSTQEDDGYILTLVYDQRFHTSHVMILDAQDLEKKPMARIWFDQHIPTTFHGNWVPST